MLIQNMTCVGLGMSFQGFLKKLFTTRSANNLVAGITTAEALELNTILVNTRDIILGAEPAKLQVSDPANVSNPGTYVPGHPNMTVDYVARSIEHIEYYLLVECTSGKVLDTGLLPHDQDMLLTFIEDIEHALSTQPVPYPSIPIEVIEVPAEEPAETKELQEPEPWISKQN